MKTNEELLACMHARLKEELGDICTYNSLYEDLSSAGLYDEAAEVEEIARDEFAHAEALADMLKMHGRDLSHDLDVAMLWKKAKAAFGLGGKE